MKRRRDLALAGLAGLTFAVLILPTWTFVLCTLIALVITWRVW